MPENKTENKSVNIHFGALADSIAVQLRKQKWKFDSEKVRIFQKELDCVIFLRFHDTLLTDSMADHCYQKLHNAIVKHVAQHNGLTVLKKKK